MGRHSAPDDYDDDASAVLSGPPQAASRPRPGRHSGERPEPTVRPAPETDDQGVEGVEGLDIIETAMADPGDVADDGAVDDRQARAAAGPAPDEHTEQIEPIVDPVLDEPLPVAVTTLIPAVVDGKTPPPRPLPQLAPQPQPQPRPVSADAVDEAPTVDEPDRTDQTDATGKPDRSEKAAAKAEAKAAKAAAKAEAKADAKAAKAGSQPGRPEPRVSDLALLRSDSAARARVIAAVVVPFLLYVGVLLVLGTLDLRTALIWIWLPLITAGVVAGLLLDLAHRAAAARAIDALDASREPASTTGTADPS